MIPGWYTEVGVARKLDLKKRALTRAGKAHRFVVVAGADHQFSDFKDRVTLLQETEGFLREHLPAVTH